jgi:peptidoglycan/xylan/chitin deacetylase (PgdA/CDA1 family)
MKKILLASLLLFFASGCAPKQSLSDRKEALLESSDSTDAETQNPDAPPEQKDSQTREVPILMYRSIRSVDRAKDPSGYNLSMEPALFEKELLWLKNNGYETISTKDLEARKVPDKSIILTFDDGYADFYTTALPILEKQGFTASLAIITDRIGQPGYMDSVQINQLASLGVELMSHGKSHSNLTEISLEQLKKEVSESKNYLEDNFDVVVGAFVYPSGDYNDETVRIVAESGYNTALTDDQGIAYLKDSLLKMKRVRIDNRDNLENFIKKVTAKD